MQTSECFPSSDYLQTILLIVLLRARHATCYNRAVGGKILFPPNCGRGNPGNAVAHLNCVERGDLNRFTDSWDYIRSKISIKNHCGYRRFAATFGSHSVPTRRVNRPCRFPLSFEELSFPHTVRFYERTLEKFRTFAHK